MMTLDELSVLSSSECDCDKCKSMCKRPCWPTPNDANRLLDAGLATKLMLDFWVGDDYYIYILAPANPGYEGRQASDSWFSFGDLTSGCTFYDKNGRCQIHHLKPLEGRVAIHGQTPGDLHESVAMTWDSDEGRRIVQKWKDLVGF